MTKLQTVDKSTLLMILCLKRWCPKQQLQLLSGGFSMDGETGDYIYEGLVILSDDELQQVGKLILTQLEGDGQAN